LNGYDCIYLLNIRDLPADASVLLAEYVRAGGGIAWFPGDQANTRWYSETLRESSLNLFPVPVGTLHEAVAEDATGTASDQKAFVNPVFEPHPIFVVYNTPDSPFPDTVQVARWLQVTDDFKPDDAERNDGVRTLIRLKNRQPVGFEHSLGKGRILTFLTGAGRRWSNWPVSPAAPGYVVMHLLMHQYLQKQTDSVELRELTEPVSLEWPVGRFNENVEVFLPEAAGDDEPIAETFVRLQASILPAEKPVAPAVNADKSKTEEPASNTSPKTVQEDKLGVTIAQADRPGIYKVRRFDSEGTGTDLAIALNVSSSESALAVADAEQLMQQADLGHVRVLDADAAQALGGSEAGREIRWVLIGLLIAVLIFEQLLALRLSYHPDVPVRS
jgi:hypothetical protein